VKCLSKLAINTKIHGLGLGFRENSDNHYCHIFTPISSYFLLTKLLTQTFLRTSCYRVGVASRSRIVIIISYYAVSVNVIFYLKFMPAI